MIMFLLLPCVQSLVMSKVWLWEFICPEFISSSDSCFHADGHYGGALLHSSAVGLNLCRQQENGCRGFFFTAEANNQKMDLLRVCAVKFSFIHARRFSIIVWSNYKTHLKTPLNRQMSVINRKTGGRPRVFNGLQSVIPPIFSEENARGTRLFWRHL